MRPPLQAPAASIRNVLVLTVIGVLLLASTIVMGFANLPAALIPRLLRDDPNALHVAPAQMAMLAASVCVFYWICTGIGNTRTGKKAALRYALKLQVQALCELATCVLVLPATWIALDLGVEPFGADGLRQHLQQLALREEPMVLLGVSVMALPALSMLATVWRMHALARVPGALDAAIDGSLFRKDTAFSGDAGDVHDALAQQLRRLTAADAPRIGRFWYDTVPALISRDVAGLAMHELVWAWCPMKLLVSAHAGADGAPVVRVRTVLRGGCYRLYVFETPADALAQMQYADTHLLQPLATRLAIHAAERQRDALRDHALATQLRILQAQIEPHFLFNTLAKVRQLYRGSLAGGEAMMDHLIAYLRCAMDDLRAEHSDIVREMDLVMHYLSIMQVRMGERLAYQFSVPESLLHHPFPPAMLISLVENAIKHGLAERDHGAIALTAAREGDLLRVSVSDDGAGFSSVGGTGVGLSNIRQRLEAMYGSRAWLEVGAPAAGGFCATIVIPCEERIS